MRKLFTLACAIVCCFAAFASANTMNYQAVINNTDGNPVVDKPVGVKFSIVSDGNTLFSEETTLTTDAHGFVQYEIGTSAQYGLSDIDWSAANLMLQVGVDLNGGTNYTSVYSSSIQSVPTAFYATRSADTEELRRETEKWIQVTYEEMRYNLDELEAKLRTMMDVSSDESMKNIAALQAALKEDLANIYDELRMRIEEGDYETIKIMEAQVSDMINDRIKELGGVSQDDINSIRQDIAAIWQQLSTLATNQDSLKADVKDITNLLNADITNLRGQVDTLNAHLDETRYRLEKEQDIRIDENERMMKDITDLMNTVETLRTRVTELENK